MSNKQIALKASKIKAATLDGDRMLRVIATTPSLDRDLESLDSNTILVPVKPKGLKYLADMTPSDEPDLPFLIDHDWRLEKQAGSVKKLYINEAGETEAVVKLSTVDNGERVYTLAKEDHLGNSFSIGYTLQNATLENGQVKNLELLELSAVFKGSNRDARLVEVKSVKEEKSMSDIDTKKAEIEAAQKELADLEAKEVTETPEESPQLEKPVVVETPVVETQVEEQPEAKPEVKPEEEAKEEAVVEETKSIKEETTKMADKQEAVKSIVTPDAPTQEVVTKTITKNEARKMIVESIAASYAKDEDKVKSLAEEMKGLKVINGTSADPLFVPEILANDIRERYLIAGNVGTLVNKIDIEGAETFRQLVETAGNGFQPVALGAVKPEDQPVWTSVVFEPFEWALIVAWLDGVQKRSPIAVYNQIVNYIAREYRKLEDKIILTNPARTVGSESRPATGLVPRLSVSGRNDNVQSYASGDVLPAIAKAWGAIESDETITLVANKATWAALAVSMDANDNPIFTVVGQEVAVGALGSFRVVTSNALGQGEVVIGAFEDYNLVTRGALATLFSREATVGSLNLFTQDASALRADVDITGGPVLIESFYLLDFGAASSS